MKIRTAMKRAWLAWKAHPGEMLAFVLLEAVLRLMCLAPLLFLTNTSLRWLALLSVPMFVLVVLPARQRAARAMLDCLRGGHLFSRRLLLGPGWGADVLAGLRTVLCMLLWSLPVLAATAWLARILFGEATVGSTDAFTLLFRVSDLGGGDVVRGVVYAALIYCALLVPVAVGLAFHSGRRHERAHGGPRVVPHHRGRVMLCWLVGCVILVPWLAVTAAVTHGYAQSLIGAVKNLGSLTGGSFAIPRPDQGLYLSLGAFALLAVPFIPFKSLMTAAFVHGLWEGKD